MQTRWKTVIMTLFYLYLLFQQNFPRKRTPNLIFKKNGWNLQTWFYMSQWKPKVYQYYLLINRLLTDTNPQGRKKCDAFCWQFWNYLRYTKLSTARSTDERSWASDNYRFRTVWKYRVSSENSQHKSDC